MALQLPPLPAYEPSWANFQTWWQQVKDAIESNAAASQEVLDALDQAIGGAGGLATQTAILGSFTIPTLVVTAADVGANVTITIAAHVRHYGNSVELPVAGGSITGKAFSTKYGIYYDDLEMVDSTPAYFATTELQEAQHNFIAGRHYVGTVTTPADGGAATTAGSPPAGSGYTAGASAVVIT